MPKKGESGKGQRDLPPEMVARVARLVTEMFEETGWTAREAYDRIGIDHATLTRAKNGKSIAGLHFYLKLRQHLGLSIDEILGLPAVAKRGRPATKHGWSDRDHSARLARLRHIPENIIQDVIAKHADARFKERKPWWWGAEFNKAHEANQKLQQAVAEFESPEVEVKPRSTRGKVGT